MIYFCYLFPVSLVIKVCRVLAVASVFSDGTFSDCAFSCILSLSFHFQAKKLGCHSYHAWCNDIFSTHLELQIFMAKPHKKRSR